MTFAQTTFDVPKYGASSRAPVTSVASERDAGEEHDQGQAESRGASAAGTLPASAAAPAPRFTSRLTKSAAQREQSDDWAFTKAGYNPSSCTPIRRITVRCPSSAHRPRFPRPDRRRASRSPVIPAGAARRPSAAARGRRGRWLRSPPCRGSSPCSPAAPRRRHRRPATTAADTVDPLPPAATSAPQTARPCSPPSRASEDRRPDLPRGRAPAWSASSRPSGQGSGFVIDERGLHRHQRPRGRGRAARSSSPSPTTTASRRRVVGSDPATDTALLKVTGPGLRADARSRSAPRPTSRSATASSPSATRSASTARSPRASSRPSAARSRRRTASRRSTTRSRPTPRSTTATPAARC